MFAVSESVIKGLNSNDDQERSNYMKKADDLIKKVSKQDTKNKDKEDEEDDLPQTRTGSIFLHLPTITFDLVNQNYFHLNILLCLNTLISLINLILPEIHFQF